MSEVAWEITQGALVAMGIVALIIILFFIAFKIYNKWLGL